MPKPTLLAVDDDTSVLEAVVHDLRRQYGQFYRIVRAASGATALDICRQLKERNETVALFLSDQRMPGMTGVELLQQVIPLYPDAKRVLLTAYADTEAAIRAINSDLFPTNVEGNRRYVPGYQVAIMKGVGHYLMLEQPEAFNALLAEALRELARSGGRR